MNTKPNLLLLHGAMGSSDQFSELKEIIKDYYQVYCLNFSGHGGDDLSDKSFSIELFSSDVLEFLNKLKLDSVYIFGYSMGGYVAIALAMKFPNRIQAVMTLATKFDWTPENALKEVSLMNAETMKIKIPAYVTVLEKRYYPIDWQIVLEKTKDMMLKLGYNPLTDLHFEQIKCKVRIVVGDRDKMVSIASSYPVFKKLENGSLLVLPDTSHPFESVNVLRLKFEFLNFFKIRE